MSKNKIIDYFLKQAEIGNWDKTKFPDVEKKLNLKKNSIKKLFTEKSKFNCSKFEYFKSLSYEKKYPKFKLSVSLNFALPKISDLFSFNLDLVGRNSFSLNLNTFANFRSKMLSPL